MHGRNIVYIRAILMCLLVRADVTPSAQRHEAVCIIGSIFCLLFIVWQFIVLHMYCMSLSLCYWASPILIAMETHTTPCVMCVLWEKIWRVMQEFNRFDGEECTLTHAHSRVAHVPNFTAVLIFTTTNFGQIY